MIFIYLHRNILHIKPDRIFGDTISYESIELFNI